MLIVSKSLAFADWMLRGRHHYEGPTREETLKPTSVVPGKEAMYVVSESKADRDS